MQSLLEVDAHLARNLTLEELRQNQRLLTDLNRRIRELATRPEQRKLRRDLCLQRKVIRAIYQAALVDHQRHLTARRPNTAAEAQDIT